MARLVGTGVALLALVALAVMMLTLSSEPGRLLQSAVEPMWKVTRANSAHHALVVDVETQDMEQAHRIATEIVDPVRTRDYEEILIYVRPMRQPDGPTRRIQWTPRDGYVESSY